MKLIIATSYFPVSADIDKNLRNILLQMRTAKKRRADVIHFPECALSGYAGTDFKSYKKFDWETLEASTRRVLEEAKVLGIWVLLGSTHRLSGRNKPHNSLYIINDKGKIVDRYDKLFCAGPKSGKSGDLAHYSSGNHFATYKIKGIRCGTLICHDSRYPELYRQYKRLGVQLMFHSYHAGNIPTNRWNEMGRSMGKQHLKLNGASTLPGIVFPATMQSMAANNFVWISCSNSSAKYSCFPAFFVRPDGVITGKLKINKPGLLITKINTTEPLYDSTVAWRDRAIGGTYHSGKLVRDKRSNRRGTL